MTPKFELFKNLDNLQDTFRAYIIEHWNVQDVSSHTMCMLLANDSAMAGALSAIRYNLDDWKHEKLPKLTSDKINQINSFPDQISSILLRIVYDALNADEDKELYLKCIHESVGLVRTAKIINSQYLNEVLGFPNSLGQKYFGDTTKEIVADHLTTIYDPNLNGLTRLCLISISKSTKIEQDSYAQSLLSNIITHASHAINSEQEYNSISVILETLIDTNRIDSVLINSDEQTNIRCMLRLYDKTTEYLEKYKNYKPEPFETAFDVPLEINIRANRQTKFENLILSINKDVLVHYRLLKDMDLSHEHIIDACTRKSAILADNLQINY